MHLLLTKYEYTDVAAVQEYLEICDLTSNYAITDINYHYIISSHVLSYYRGRIILIELYLAIINT